MAESGDNCGPTTESEDPFVPDEVVDRVSPGSGQAETKSRRTAKPSGKTGKRRASGSCTPETKGPKRRRRAVTRKGSTKRRRSVTKKSGGSKRRCTKTANPKRRRGNTKKGRSCSGGGRVRGLNGSPCIRRPGGPRGIIKKPSKPTGQRCSSPSVKKPRKNFKPAVGPENRKRPPGVFVSYYLDLLKRDQKEVGKQGKRPPILATVKKASECWKGLDEGTKERYRKKYCSEWKRIKNRRANGRC